MGKITVTFLNELEKTIVGAANEQKGALLKLHEYELDIATETATNDYWEKMNTFNNVYDFNQLKQKKLRLENQLKETQNLIDKVSRKIVCKLNPGFDYVESYQSPTSRALVEMANVQGKIRRELTANHPLIGHKIEELNEIIMKTRQKLIIAGSDADIRNAFTELMDIIKNIAEG